MKLRDITRDNVKDISDKLLLELHRKCHMLYEGAKKRVVTTDLIKFIVELHEIIVEEMDRRGFKHKSPLSYLDKIYSLSRRFS